MSRDIHYFNLNEPPLLPADGGLTSLPHRFLLVGAGQPLGCLAVTDKLVIDFIYVTPDARRTGVATALLARATSTLGRIRHDERLSPNGLAFMRARRVLFTGNGRRKATIPQDRIEATGAEHLAGYYRLHATYLQHLITEHTPNV